MYTMTPSSLVRSVSVPEFALLPRLSGTSSVIRQVSRSSAELMPVGTDPKFMPNSTAPNFLHDAASPSPSLVFTGVCRRSKRRATTLEPASPAATDLSFATDLRSTKRRSPPSSQLPSTHSLEQSSSSYSLNTIPLGFTSPLFGLFNDSYLSSYPYTSPPDDRATAQPQIALLHNGPSEPASTDTAVPDMKRSSASKGTGRQSSPLTSSSGTATTPRPIQFINNVAPAVSRPKPVLGTYVQTQSAIQQKARKQLREEGKIKRSSNCFIKYRTRIHPLIVAHYGNQNNKEISKLAGQCWRNEPEWVKSIYRQQAHEEKLIHESLYPTYKYTPTRPSTASGSAATGAQSNSKSNNANRTTLTDVNVDTDTIQAHASSDRASRPSGSEPQRSYESDAETNLSSKYDRTSSNPDITKELAAPSSPSSSAPATPKPTKEKSYVVTETALHEFTGNSELTARPPVKSRSRSRSQSQSRSRSCSRSSSRTPMSRSRLASTFKTPSTQLSPVAEDHISMAGVDFAKEFTFVVQGPAPSSSRTMLPQSLVSSDLMSSIMYSSFPCTTSSVLSSTSSSVSDRSCDIDAFPSPGHWLSNSAASLRSSPGLFDVQSSTSASSTMQHIDPDMLNSILNVPVGFELSLPGVTPKRAENVLRPFEIMAPESAMFNLGQDIPSSRSSHMSVQPSSPAVIAEPSLNGLPDSFTQFQPEQQSAPLDSAGPRSNIPGGYIQGFPWHLGLTGGTTDPTNLGVNFSSSTSVRSLMPFTTGLLQTSEPQASPPSSSHEWNFTNTDLIAGQWTDDRYLTPSFTMLPLAASSYPSLQTSLSQAALGPPSSLTNTFCAPAACDSVNRSSYSDVLATSWGISSSTGPSPRVSSGTPVPLTEPSSMASPSSSDALESRRPIMESDLDSCSDEELKMSIEYCERLLELQKIRLALQQHKQQQ